MWELEFEEMRECWVGRWLLARRGLSWSLLDMFADYKLLQTTLCTLNSRIAIKECSICNLNCLLLILRLEWLVICDSNMMTYVAYISQTEVQKAISA